MRKLRLLPWLATGALLLTLAWGLAGGGARTEAQSSFAAEVAALSEPAGYFDTDNLISNERSYLDVVPDLKKRGVRGGAYVGVGPDQNFSYIAAIRPDVVFIVDVRRDNLLLHLLFKSLFTLARTRVEYLALLARASGASAVRQPGRDRELARRRARQDREARRTGPARRARDHAPAIACGPGHRQDRRAALARGCRDHRSIPSPLHPGRRRSSISVDRPAAAEPLPHVSRAAAGDRRLGHAGQLPGLGGVVPVPQVAAGARPRDSGRGRPERIAGARRHWLAPPPEGPASLGLLRVERRVLPVRRRTVRPVRDQPRRHAPSRQRRHHPIGLRPVLQLRRGQFAASAAGRRPRARLRRGRFRSYGALIER